MGDAANQVKPGDERAEVGRESSAGFVRRFRRACGTVLAIAEPGEIVAIPAGR